MPVLTQPAATTALTAPTALTVPMASEARSSMPVTSLSSIVHSSATWQAAAREVRDNREETVATAATAAPAATVFSGR
jgi:hypothetical protein